MSAGAMREGYILCADPHGFHRMRYVEWGDEHNPRVLICVHGLTRNARDFDYLAQSLADAYRVVCPDVVGRGRSDWLREKSDYTYPVYCTDMAALIGKLSAETVDWLGTSMGGIIGMILASLPGSPLRKLVLNDVGSVVPKAAVERIGRYMGHEAEFESLDALESAMRSVSPFGDLAPEQWKHLAVHSARQGEHGRWRFRYDPSIGEHFRKGPLVDVDLRAYWNAVRCPALVIRGEDSDLLTPAILEEMRRRPHTETVVVPRTGHPPMLMKDAEVMPIRRFLLG
jgi:pimeloyl-ACP methyl ester carboxylesterase